VLESSATSLGVRWPVGDGVGRLRLAGDGPRVRGEGEVTASRMNKVTMGFTIPEDEHVFGLGERFATFDHRVLDGMHAAKMAKTLKRLFDDPVAGFGPLPDDKTLGS
jgi:hypothetical protein